MSRGRRKREKERWGGEGERGESEGEGEMGRNVEEEGVRGREKGRKFGC